MFSRILCPTDFSDRSRGAAHAASALARQFQAEILALHVSASAEVKNSEAERKLGEFVSKELDGCVVSPCIVSGAPAQAIVEFARDRRSDLIVMATHGISPFRQFQLGSVTARVLHLAACPVWTSSHLEDWPAVNSLPLRSIICALDFGPRSCAALHWGSRLAREFGAELTLAHVARPDHAEYATEPPEYTLQRQRERLHMLSTQRILKGAPGPVLSELADEIAADLMVIGRTHASSEGLGANAYTIIAHSPCPVLSV